MNATDTCRSIAAAKALTLYFDTPIAGLWRDKLLADAAGSASPRRQARFIISSTRCAYCRLAGRSNV